MERVPFPCYLVQLSAVLSLSAYCMGCHTAAAVGARRRGKCLAAVPSCGSWLHLCWKTLEQVLKESSSKNLKLRSLLSLCLSSAQPRRRVSVHFWSSSSKMAVKDTSWEAEAVTPRNKSPGQVYRVKLVWAKSLLGVFCPPAAQMSLSSPCHGDEKTGDRIMRWLVFADDEQALVSKHFNVRTDSALISSSNDHFTLYCCSNCMFCSLRGSSAAERKTSLSSPSKKPPLSLSNLLSILLLCLSHPSQFGDAASLWPLRCLNEPWQIRNSENHVD